MSKNIVNKGVSACHKLSQTYITKLSQTYKVCNDIPTVLVCHKLRSLSQTCISPDLILQHLIFR